MTETSSLMINREGSKIHAEWYRSAYATVDRPMFPGEQPRMLRATVHLDGYEHQSYGRVEVHDGCRWGTLRTWPVAALDVQVNAGYFPPAQTADVDTTIAGDLHAMLSWAHAFLDGNLP